MAYSFDAKKTKDELVAWIRRFFEENGPGCRAVLGISGGKDSSVCAALCAEALGRDRVVGVLMPNGEQADIAMSRLLVEHLGIPHIVVNIKGAYDATLTAIADGEKEGMEAMGDELSSQTRINLAPRLRMATVYAVSQSMNGRVVNTCNLSEDWVGYSTRYGDAAGDFGPLAQLTVQEVKAVGRVLGLPEALVEKAPSDGVSGKTDEDNLGFTYAMLDRYLREGVIDDAEKKQRIDNKRRWNRFKLSMYPVYESGLPLLADDPE